MFFGGEGGDLRLEILALALDCPVDREVNEQ